MSGYIFGGYSGAKWRSEEVPVLFFGTEHDFLFTLRNPQGTKPIQFPVRNDMAHRNSCCYAEYGPSFGYNAIDNDRVPRGHCEIHVADKSNENTDSHVLGFPAMYDGKGHTNKIFCGSEKFKVEDYEVFLAINRWSKDIKDRLPIVDDPNDEHMADVPVW